LLTDDRSPTDTDLRSIDIGFDDTTPGRELYDPCEQEEKMILRRAGCPHMGEQESDRSRVKQGAGDCPVAFQYLENIDLRDELTVLPKVETEESSSGPGVSSVALSNGGILSSDIQRAKLGLMTFSTFTGVTT